ncbi:MAG: hypothetical protein QT11_C0001G0294 [archaeon GW2011_AR20]|nr:MAG: hypothetical protein QT11_C0001G0294 [archaeon GW2011_AR20]AQS28462.1 hypothetical protein [uncultured archaeon]
MFIYLYQTKILIKMPFIGFNFDKISAEREVDEVKGNINVKHSFNIKDVREEKVNLDKKQDVLKFTFEFSLNYEPGLGSIKIEGHLLYIDEQKKMNEMVKGWKKEKKISPEIIQGLFNTIIARSNIKALQLEQDLNLPPHLPMPKLTREKKSVREYIG